MSQTPRSVFKPQPGSQTLAVSCPADELLHSGTRGSAKTWALLFMFLAHVGRGHGRHWRGVIFRRLYPGLEDIKQKALELIPQIWPKAKFNESNYEWTFPAGEKLYLRQIEREKEYWQKYHGHEYPFIGWDELVAWESNGCYEIMKGCNRSPRPGVPKMIRATANPYGPGHGWVKSYFVDKKAAGQLVKNKAGVTRTWLRSSVFENEILMSADPGYIDKLRSIKDPIRRRAWLGCDWDITGGGMFDDILNSLTEKYWFIRPFRIPKEWRVFRSFDWGESHPFSVGWWAVANGDPVEIDGHQRTLPKGSRIRIHEWYGWTGKENEGLRLRSADVAKGIEEREKGYLKELGVRKVEPGPADDQIFDTKADIDSIHSQYRAVAGYDLFVKANKSPGSRVPGWKTCRDMFSESLKPHPENPVALVFDTCRDGFRRTFAALQRDEKNPDDVGSKEDHVGDETRYFLNWKPPAPARKVPLGGFM